MTRKLRRKRSYTAKRVTDAEKAAALVREADARYLANESGKAMKLYKAAVKAGARGRAPAMFVMLLGIEEPERALKMADRLISKEPDNGAAYAARGTILADSNMHLEAADDYATAARKDPDHKETYFHMGLTLSSLGRHAEAAEAYQRSVEMRPDNLESIQGLCMELENLGRYEEALDLLKRKERETGLSAINMHLGRVYGKLGDWKNAYANHAKAVRLPRPTKANLANDHIMEQYRNISAIRTWANAQEPRLESFHHLASALLDAGWDRNALNAIDTATRIKPDYLSYSTMGALCTRYSFLHSAIKHFESALETLGENPSSLKDLRLTYERLVVLSFNCGLFRKLLDYSGMALRRGIKSEEIEMYSRAVLSEHGENPEDMDQVRGGWTNPDWM